MYFILIGVQGEELEVPSEDQCRPYIEKALKHLGTEGEEAEDLDTIANAQGHDEDSGDRTKRETSAETTDEENQASESSENEIDQGEVETVASTEEENEVGSENTETEESTGDSTEQGEESKDAETEGSQETQEVSDGNNAVQSEETKTEEEVATINEESGEQKEDGSVQDETASQEATNEVDESVAPEETEPEIAETSQEAKTEEAASSEVEVEEVASSQEDEAVESTETEEKSGEVVAESESQQAGEESSPEEEELIMEIEIPEVLRPRDHISQLLKLDEENEMKEKAVEQVADVILKDLKKLYDNAIKPLETLYKYRDLSNRHFGDPEIFSKPLVLFMGPWSGGKSSIINYLLDIEYQPTSLRTGAEPSPAYFNILMHGEEEEILDGTQLAADWTFSGLQKFGQGLLDRLKGYKLKNKLLEKVNIVEIPGILEIRKQVQRLFPFNDACQWFIDRADIIFLVYDPSKLDVGPETEAILDQLKGREYQTRIILNKADQVKPEELMRVQGALIWNISPLMSSAEPPVMYSASLWSIPYEAGAPTRLLYAQERALLRDLRSAIDKRVDHKIASARRFAVRVRNHAKMVDCYLTTFYNHKGFFAKRKEVADRIIETPQEYHIYEGLSTLTNISRYDLPDPDVYRDFFRLNALYDFPLLSTTCTYFRGCPINRLDVAIAYDLPELVGKYRKTAEASIHQLENEATPVTTSTAQLSPGQQEQQTQQGKPAAAKSGASRISIS
ncbi:hypothetical protein QAD02_009958 [Eretmocerus hayati]|uniref:Uncharacterized protein n=1 Tax=Eretmocerus hayati TaxID=131215 RepID=A0ACC2NFF4_9HYME|nr:hypothetical protein QAD02_009958 [Eretmocerus hayati]